MVDDSMTDQRRELIFIEDQQFEICNEPLGSFFRKTPKHLRPRFEVQWTDCWRGYHGTWLISEDRLYFTGIDALFEDGSPATLAKLFPGQDTPVFASTYIGELRIPHGRCLSSSLMRCRSNFEFDLLIAINRGLVVSRQTRTNY